MYRSALVSSLAILALAACDDAIAPPAAPARIEASGNVELRARVGTAVDSLAVRVLDASGRAVASTTVRWTAGSGSIAPATAMTGPDGVARAQWVLGTQAGTQQAAATVEGAGEVVFEAEALTGPAAEIELEPDGAITAEILDELEVEVRALDEFGNALPDSALSWITTNADVMRAPALGIGHAAGRGTAWLVAVAGEARDSVHVTVDQVWTDVETDQLGEPLTCALSAGRRWYCWGPDERAREVIPGWRFDEIGGRCALTPAEEAHCVPATPDLNRARDRVAPTLAFTQVATGGSDACGIATDGMTYCWGPRRIDAQRNPISGDPVEVPGGHAFVGVTVGGGHFCGWTADGTLYCWGDNNLGELGTGEISREPVTVPMPVVGDMTFLQALAGADYTCGRTADGVYCWGHNWSGQLGHSDSPRCDKTWCQPTPTRVNSDIVFTDIATGSAHACGLAPDGATHCWGENPWDASVSPSSQHRLLDAPPFVDVTAAGRVGCGLTADKEIYCWGEGAGATAPGEPHGPPGRILDPRIP